jgi:hypothetical protein
MATKAERFKAEVERQRAMEQARARKAAKNETTASTSRARRAASSSAGPGPLPTGGQPKAHHNHLARAPRAVYQHEESSGPKPSRKSSRGSGNRQKAGAQLKAKRTLETLAPRNQHGRDPQVSHKR